MSIHKQGHMNILQEDMLSNHRDPKLRMRKTSADGQKLSITSSSSYYADLLKLAAIKVSAVTVGILQILSFEGFVRNV